MRVNASDLLLDMFSGFSGHPLVLNKKRCGGIDEEVTCFGKIETVDGEEFVVTVIKTKRATKEGE